MHFGIMMAPAEMFMVIHIAVCDTSGIPIDDPGKSKNGMVIDFTDLKSIVKKEIVNVF